MPDPSSYDDEDAWMSACVPAVMDEGKPRDQAVAQCLNMWREKAAAAEWHDFKPPAVDRVKKAYGTITRAYSRLDIKAVDDERRIIKGIASTPTVDRVGDVVEPLGAQFAVPMALMLDHNHHEQVGHVHFAKPTKSGIPFEARIVKFDEPGEVKNLVDKAWHLVKTKLRSFVSIGFKPLEGGIELMEDGGLRFTKWEWMELSLVSIPANREAVIMEAKSLDAAMREIKSLDQGLQAASGTTEAAVATRPGASGKTPVNLRKPEYRKMSKTIGEQVADLESSRSAKAGRLQEIMQKSMDEGRSTDEAEQEDFDTLQREVEAIDADLKRFRALEKMMQEKAKPVAEIKTVDDGSAARGGYVRVTAPKLPPGIRFARIARCLAMAQGNRSEAATIAEAQYGTDQEVTGVLKAAARFGEVSDLAVKAAVSAASSQESQWAGSLVSAAAGESGAIGDFLEFLRPQTILGKFGTGGIPNLRRVPFRTGLLSQVSGGSAYWVAEAAPKPLTRFDLTRTTLTPLKIANIAVATDELVRDSSPSADELIRDTLAKALREQLDRDFIDPANTGTAGSKPASITSGATQITSSGSGGAGVGSAVQVRTDLRAMVGQFQANNNDLENGVWIMRPTTAMNLSLMTNALGAPDPLVTGMTMGGGQLLGMPIIVSQYLPSTGSPIGDFVVLVDAQSVWLADEGGLVIDMSREASLEMLDSTLLQHAGVPASPSVQSVGASLVSLWQVNCVGFRAERTINWAVARPGGVAVLTGGNWGEP